MTTSDKTAFEKCAKILGDLEKSERLRVIKMLLEIYSLKRTKSKPTFKAAKNQPNLFDK
jgi:hypothetical protein